METPGGPITAEGTICDAALTARERILPLFLGEKPIRDRARHTESGFT
jgi:hypothetical protein